MVLFQWVGFFIGLCELLFLFFLLSPLYLYFRLCGPMILGYKRERWWLMLFFGGGGGSCLVGREKGEKS